MEDKWFQEEVVFVSGLEDGAVGVGGWGEGGGQSFRDSGAKLSQRGGKSPLSLTIPGHRSPCILLILAGILSPHEGPHDLLMS